MFDLLVENPSPLVAITIGSVFKRVSREGNRSFKHEIPALKSEIFGFITTVSLRSCFEQIAVDGQLVANELAPAEKASVSMTVQQSRRSRMTLK